MDYLKYVLILNGLFGLINGNVGPNCPKNYMFSCQPMVVPIPCQQQQQLQQLQQLQQMQQLQPPQPTNPTAGILLGPSSAITTLLEQQQQQQQQQQLQTPQLQLQLQQPETKSAPLISVMPLRPLNYFAGPSPLPYVAELPCQRSMDAARDVGVIMKNDQNERRTSVPSTLNYPFPTTDKQHMNFSKHDNVEIMGCDLYEKTKLIVMLLKKFYIKHHLTSILHTFLFIMCNHKTQATRSYLRIHHFADNQKKPCQFYQTINITDAIHLPNDTYLYNNVLIPSNWTSIYDYIITNHLTREPVAPHLRGCICKVKSCINICCRANYQFNLESKLCLPINTTLAWPKTIPVHLDNGIIKHGLITKEFAIVNFPPCLTMFKLMPEEQSDDEWHLHQNGSILRPYDQISLDIKHYCLTPTRLNDSNTEYILNPLICENSDYIIVQKIYAYGMLISIPFMLITILIYLVIPELRNQHGKSLVCYLWGLTIGYSILCFNSLFMRADVDLLTCKIMGYGAYYSFMAAFLWLNVISFDLWHNFCGTLGLNRFKENKYFLFYSLYAWGLALIFLIFTWYAQEIADIPKHLKPEIDRDYCWLNMSTWSALIYFFGPIIFITLTNTIMFIMTFMRINQVKREMCKMVARGDSTKNLRSERDTFGLFLRLFLVMGVTWSWEILSYFVGSHVSWSKIFYIGDICNATQGCLIFILFVLKHKVMKLIIKRISGSKKASNKYSRNNTPATTNSIYLTNSTMN